MNNKRVIKKYRLKESIKVLLTVIILQVLLILFLFYYSNRIEKIENTGDTTQKSVNVEILRK